MNRHQILTAAFLGSAIALGSLVADASTAFAADRAGKEEAKKQAAGPTVRAEIGTPLKAAQELVKAKKFKEALAKVREADGIADKTPYETFVLEETRGFILMKTGDQAAAAKAFEEVVGTGQLPEEERIKRVQAIGQLYYQAKDYGKAATWLQRYLKEAGPNQDVRNLMIQALYLAGDYPAAGKELGALVAAQEKAGQAVDEQSLQLLANIALKQKDDAGYVAAIEKLVRHHPKPEYWQDLILRVQKKPGFNRDRLALDVYRLMFATGIMSRPDDYVEMAQLALGDNIPGEAKVVLEKGFAAGILGKAQDAERHKRLLDMAVKQAAEDQKTLAASEKDVDAAPSGGPAIRLGDAYAGHGQYQKAATWLEKGLKKGGLKQTEDARLHLGIAYLKAGDAARAKQTLAAVKGTDGPADLARLWQLVGKAG